MMKGLVLAVSALVVSAAVSAAERNVVLIVTDDQSPDAGCYGNRVVQTPALDALAADGVLFRKAFCTTASCSSSRSVILTGMHNHANGHYGHEHAYHKFSSYPGVRSLPVMLAEADYRTARCGKYHVAPEAVYKFEQSIPGNSRNAVQMANNCRDFVAEKTDRPFFLYFCTSDPHRSGGVKQDSPQKPNLFGNERTYDGVTEITYKPEDVIVPGFLPDTPECRAELAEYYQSISRIDQGVGNLVEHLKAAGVYDDTLIIYISDHGIAMPGAKTTVYEGGLHSPCIVRNPYVKPRGIETEAMVSWVDLTPTILDFAGVKASGPKRWQPQGRSFLPVLKNPDAEGWDEVYASHTFHEITMYYPMRVVRQRRYKLIWNIAHDLPYPFASDLWIAPTWQSQYKQGPDAPYGAQTVGGYIHRPEFELFDLEADPYEGNNLADDPRHADRLAAMKAKLKEFQKRTDDPWILKWQYE